MKPRKQDNSSQEGEAKTKVSGTKRIKNESQKSKKEKDNAQKPQDAPEVGRFPAFQLKLYSFNHVKSGDKVRDLTWRVPTAGP